MNEGSLQEVLKALPNLSKDDLEQVKARVLFLIHMGSPPEGSPTDNKGDADWVMQCICDCLTAAGVEHCSMYFLRRYNAGQGAFKRKVPDLMHFLQDQAPNNRAVQRALLMTGIELLHRNLSQMQVTATGRTMMNHIHRIPAVLNLAFPGYAGQKHLGMLIRKEGTDARQE